MVYMTFNDSYPSVDGYCGDVESSNNRGIFSEAQKIAIFCWIYSITDRLHIIVLKSVRYQ